MCLRERCGCTRMHTHGANLHSVWALFENLSLLKQFRTSIHKSSIPLWRTARGNIVSVSRFCDNLNVAANGPTTQSQMAALYCPPAGICLGYATTLAPRALFAMEHACVAGYVPLASHYALLTSQFVAAPV